MLGAGTVGGGVYEIIAKRGATSLISIDAICVRSLDKPRDFTILSHTNVTTNPNDLLTDDIDCLVEVAGGSSGVVKDTVFRALQMGKTVVTANKALLAEHLGDIQDILKSHPTARIGYEAAVCGGIPIIHTLATCYTGDVIRNVMGICNGTTNYMLTHMEQDSNISYDAILKEAQDLGYAEADPTADVEGHDVRAKIALLAQTAFGSSALNMHTIPCKGISQISSLDFAIAKQRNCTIKLIGTAEQQGHETNNVVSVYVTPALVPLSHTLAPISGSGNCVAVTSENMGVCLYAGPGAGRFPTANSILADMDRAATGTLPSNAFAVTNSQVTVSDEYSANAWYMRFGTVSSLANLMAAAERAHVPITSVQFHDGQTILTAGACPHSSVVAFGTEHSACLWMPILE